MNDHVIPREPGRGFDASKLVVGLLLVSFGLAFLFDRLYWFDAFGLVRLWPLWLILFGVVRILFPTRGRGRLAGFWPLLIGGIFLLDTQDLLPLHDSWPLFIVGAGLLLMLRATGVGGCHRQREKV